MRKRRKKPKSSLGRKHIVNIPTLSNHSFSNKTPHFHCSLSVETFLRYKRISYHLIKNLDGPGEYKDGQYNCNKIFFSRHMPKERKVVAYWDYEREFLYY